MPSVVKGHSRFRDTVLTNRHLRAEERRCHPTARRRVWMEFGRPLSMMRENEQKSNLPARRFVEDGIGYLWGDSASVLWQWGS